MINTALYVIATIPDNVLKPITMKLIMLCLHNKIWMQQQLGLSNNRSPNVSRRMEI